MEGLDRRNMMNGTEERGLGELRRIAEIRESSSGIQPMDSEISVPVRPAIWYCSRPTEARGRARETDEVVNSMEEEDIGMP